jgi:hypothetical protein
MTDIDDGLMRYLAVRERARSAEVERTLAAMTLREQAMVREAAVMGHVRGVLFGAAHGRGARIPADSAMLADVISACLAMPDLYPAISGLAESPAEVDQ